MLRVGTFFVIMKSDAKEQPQSNPAQDCGISGWKLEFFIPTAGVIDSIEQHIIRRDYMRLDLFFFLLLILR